MSCSGLGVTGHPQGRDELYRFFFDWNPQPMWVWDLHTLHFLAANEGATRQTRCCRVKARLFYLRPPCSQDRRGAG